MQLLATVRSFSPSGLPCGVVSAFNVGAILYAVEHANAADSVHVTAGPRLQQGTRGTYAGFPATIVRHYDGNMYEIRVPGGVTCVDAGDFVAEGGR